MGAETAVGEEKTLLLLFARIDLRLESLILLRS